jgi:hypothetical protein
MEYYVEADSPDQAQEIFEAYRETVTRHDEVTFTQNYTHILTTKGRKSDDY